MAVMWIEVEGVRSEFHSWDEWIDALFEQGITNPGSSGYMIRDEDGTVVHWGKDGGELMTHLTLTFVVHVDGEITTPVSELSCDQAMRLIKDDWIQFYAVEEGVSDHAVLLGAEPNSAGQSINEFCSALPQQRYSHEAKGKRLRFQRTGLVMVPYSQVRGGWHCVVVEGNKTYPVGGYDLFVSDIEIMTALEVE